MTPRTDALWEINRYVSGESILGWREGCRGLETELDAAKREMEELRAALRGVISVADRDTDEFIRARAALAAKSTEQGESPQ